MKKKRVDIIPECKDRVIDVSVGYGCAGGYLDRQFISIKEAVDYLLSREGGKTFAIYLDSGQKYTWIWSIAKQMYILK